MDVYGPYYECYDLIRRNGGIALTAGYVENDEQAMDAMSRADGLFLIGGEDINPALYGEEKMDVCGGISEDRDLSEMALVKAALAQKKPIIGVCRGCQFLNVALGGTLWQDIPSQLGSEVNHNDRGEGGYMIDYAHNVTVVEGSPLHQLLGETQFKVNTGHHQAIKDLAEGAVVQAKADDGIIESFYYDKDGQYVVCYQWHPESQKPTDQNNRLAKDFLRICAERM